MLPQKILCMLTGMLRIKARLVDVQIVDKIVLSDCLLKRRQVLELLYSNLSLFRNLPGGRAEGHGDVTDR